MNGSEPRYCKCAFTDPDGTFVAGESCPFHPDVVPQLQPPPGTPSANTFRGTERAKRFTEHELIPVWIRAHVPEFGNVEAIVTAHATEALLWRSQRHPVTQVFMVINNLVTV